MCSQRISENQIQTYMNNGLQVVEMIQKSLGLIHEARSQEKLLESGLLTSDQANQYWASSVLQYLNSKLSLDQKISAGKVLSSPDKILASSS